MDTIVIHEPPGGDGPNDNGWLRDVDLLFRQREHEYVEFHANEFEKCCMVPLQKLWWYFHENVCGAVMKSPPTYRVQTVNPKQVCCFRAIGGNGSKGEASIPESIFTGRHPVLTGQGSERGLPLFLADIVLHLMVHQCREEVFRANEAAYHGYGPVFARICNQWSAKLGLGFVRHKRETSDLPLCSGWPFAVRTPGQYEGSVDLRKLLRVPTGGDAESGDPTPHPRPQADPVDRVVRAYRRLRVSDRERFQELTGLAPWAA